MGDLSSVLKKIKICDCNEPYVFISYSSADRELVWHDVLEFQKRGYNIWLDEKNLDKTRDSWKEDALTAIEDMDCALLVFYVSESSLCSEACYQELSKTVADSTKALHFGPVKFIAIDAEEVGDIMAFHQRVFDKIKLSNLEKEERKKQALTLNGFMQQFFNSNNEKVRIHPKNEKNRKMDYYEEILASFPDEARIYQDETPVMAKVDTEKDITEKKPAAEAGKAEIEPPVVAEPPVKEVYETQMTQPEADSVAAGEPSVEDERVAEEVDEIQMTPHEKEPIAEGEPAEEQFTHYEERAQDAIIYGENSFRKKNVSEAQMGDGIYRLTEGYTSIDAPIFGSVFSGRSDIVQMELPDSMKELNSGEFHDCVNMKKIRMPKYLEKIPTSVFKRCSSLTEIEVPGNVSTIDAWAFQECSSLRRIKLPKGLKKLGIAVFEKCYSLEELYLPPSLEEVGFNCFFKCTSLKDVTIPGSLKTIPTSIFEGCTSLNKVVIEDGVETIDGSSFGGGIKQLEIWIPASVVKISDIIFYKSTAIIHCDAGSYAQRFAEKEKISYILNT